mgnify:FL=1
MKRFNMTISREFGCNAREITRQLASRLGVKMYDKDLVDLAAKKAGIRLDMFTDVDRLIDSPEEKLIRSFGYGSTSGFYSDKAVKAQMDVIRDIANHSKEPCIFFGRCADYVLKEHPNTLNVFLYSDLDYRIAHMAEAYDLSYPAAERMIKRIDRQRHNYYKYVTGVNRSDHHLKHISLDVHHFGSDVVVDILYDLVMREYGEESDRREE